jgi:hypothetical protein
MLASPDNNTAAVDAISFGIVLLSSVWATIKFAADLSLALVRTHSDETFSRILTPEIDAERLLGVAASIRRNSTGGLLLIVIGIISQPPYSWL